MIIARLLCFGVFIVVGFSKVLTTDKPKAMINGVSLVAPRDQIEGDHLLPVKNLAANWIAIIPYAFINPNHPEVTFDHERQWWGERTEGTIATIKMSQALGLKIMLKPHVWIRGQGWAGDFSLQNEEQWKLWSESYTKYLIHYAKIADSLAVDMLCIGTEFRMLVKEKPSYWINLIEKIRLVYSGKLIYAANWDNYEQVKFWDQLDYIGIDAYFPLSEEKTPNPDNLNERWKRLTPKLQDFSRRHNRNIVFTEFGYQSIDYTTAGHWKYNQDTLQINLTAQRNAYQSIFESLWSESWFSGGFVWKWHAWHERYGGPTCKRYTPQNKPSEELIKDWYKK